MKLQTFFDNKTLTNVSYTSLAKRNFMKRVSTPSATNVVLLVVVVVLGVVISTKAFSFHNRSSSNFAYSLVTTLSTIAPCRIFKLSPN